MSKDAVEDQSKLPATARLDHPRFLVAIEFHSQDAAVDHFIDLQNTGWPRGPNEKDLKLIVIRKQGDGGQIGGFEFGVGQLNMIHQALARPE